MSIWKPALLGLLLPAVLAAPLVAQDRGGLGGPRMIFEEVDLNNDGTVTLEELQNVGQARFAQADTDGNGVLTRAEMIARAQDRMEQRVDRIIARADTDDDGALSFDEITEARADARGPNPERVFARMDADQDGQVTEAEFQAATEAFMERHGHRGAGHRG